MDADRRHARAQRRVLPAFTLLELLVGLALAITLLGAMAWFVSDLVDTRERLGAASARDGAATAIFERLESDLAFAVTADSDVSGVRGDESDIEILTRGVLLADAAPQLGDLQRQEYRFDSQAGVLLVRRGAVGARGAASGSAHPLLVGHLERVRFRYHDGSEWRDEFDSRRDGGLPMLVEIALWWIRPGSDANGAVDADALDNSDPSLEQFADFLDDPRDGPRTRQIDLDELFRDDDRPPDRLRVIRIPDARAIDADAAPFAAESAADDLPPIEGEP